MHSFVSEEKRKNLNAFSNVGCNDWHNITEKQSIRVEPKFYEDAFKDFYSLINRVEKPKGTVDYNSDIAYREKCNKYPKDLEVIARAIHFHGR